MRPHYIAGILILTLCACSPSTPMLTQTPTLLIKETYISAQEQTVSATATPKPTYTFTLSETSVEYPTEIPEPTPILLPTPIALNDPRITHLENSGFIRAQLKQFIITAETDSTRFSEYDDNPDPQLTQGEFSYVQYDAESHNNCALVFTALENNQNKILSIIEPAKLNQRIKEATSDPIVLFTCAPYSWGDINQNGNPDLPVSFEWANQYTGSEVHIFEVNDNMTITDITANLPGIVSPWEFNPSNYQTKLKVIDIAWAEHDCIYPPIEVFWIFDWRDGKYVNITQELDFSKTLESMKTNLSAGFKGSLKSSQVIGRMTELLLLYDYSGQRDKGWDVYMAITDMKNWPGTDENYSKWIQSDLAHFEKQYREKQPFTPNNYCKGQ